MVADLPILRINRNVIRRASRANLFGLPDWRWPLTRGKCRQHFWLMAQLRPAKASFHPLELSAKGILMVTHHFLSPPRRGMPRTPRCARPAAKWETSGRRVTDDFGPVDNAHPRPPPAPTPSCSAQRARPGARRPCYAAVWRPKAGTGSRFTDGPRMTRVLLFAPTSLYSCQPGRPGPACQPVCVCGRFGRVRFPGNYHVYQHLDADEKIAGVGGGVTRHCLCQEPNLFILSRKWPPNLRDSLSRSTRNSSREYSRALRAVGKGRSGLPPKQARNRKSEKKTKTSDYGTSTIRQRTSFWLCLFKWSSSFAAFLKLWMVQLTFSSLIQLAVVKHELMYSISFKATLRSCCTLSTAISYLITTLPVWVSADELKEPVQERCSHGFYVAKIHIVQDHAMSWFM